MMPEVAGIVVFMVYDILGIGYFDVDSILETILPQSVMCVYIAIIAIILPVMLWRVDSAPAFKCNDYE